MNRRGFILFVGGAAIPSITAHISQAAYRMRRIGVLHLLTDAATGRSPLTQFQDRLQKLGWTAGRNVLIDARRGSDDLKRAEANAAELVQTAPDVIFAAGTVSLKAVLQATRSIPIVFVQVTDPVAEGYVQSLSRPGGNVTGIANPGSAISGARLRALKEIAPQITRAMVIHDANYRTPPGLLQAAEAAAVSLKIDLTVSGVSDVEDMERQIGEFSKQGNGGLVVIQNPFFASHKDRIIALAELHHLPAVYPFASFVEAGGLMSYGVNIGEMWLEAASYVDKILRGADPGKLPAQEAKPELVINAKTTRTLDLKLPTTLLGLATWSGGNSSFCIVNFLLHSKGRKTCVNPLSSRKKIVAPAS
jgi:putative ABC transport system substrate-binding protein